MNPFGSKMMTAEEYGNLQVDDVVRTTTGEEFKIKAFPDNRPWGKNTTKGGNSQPLRREQLVSSRQAATGRPVDASGRKLTFKESQDRLYKKFGGTLAKLAR